jgi:D-alanyl-D-alanine carboxypeptidase/D-alanyl-D-alanine-endopeptidase (penicillin-binding protein 4)
MVRQNLQAAVCLVVLAAAGSRLRAQTVPANPGTRAADAGAQTAASPSALLPVSLATQIADLVNDPAVSRYHWGILVTNLDGSPIYGLNQGQLFEPASNVKLYTTAAALALLGADKQFETKVVAVGNLDRRGVLHGDLKLVGGGDANFGTQNLPYLPPSARPKNPPPAPTGVPDIEQLADQVVAKGLHEVMGNIVGDDSASEWEGYPGTWQVDDLLWGYGAPVSALTVHDNAIDVTVAPDREPHPTQSPKATIHTTPDQLYYAIVNHVYTMGMGATDCDSRLLFHRDLGSKTLEISGDIGRGSAPCTEHIAIEDPAEFAALALKSALERRGVRVTGTATTLHWNPGSLPGSPGYTGRLPDTPEDRKARDGFVQSLFDHPGFKLTCAAQPVAGPAAPPETELASHTSPPLLQDIIFTNKVSQNLHAELLVRDLGTAYTCGTDVPGSLSIVRQWLMHIGIDKDDFVFYDGSGLSNHDLVTPRATAKLLQFATTQPWYVNWKASLPVGGEDGTLGGRFAKPPLKDHLFAKTGTLGEARALSGYLDCASGRTVIFSIMVDNHLPGTPADRDTLDKIVAAIQAAE